MSYYAVIDTNVLVAALLSAHTDSATVLVLDKIFTKEVVVVYSQEIIDEYKDVLNRPKLKFDPRTVDELIEVIKKEWLSYRTA